VRVNGFKQHEISTHSQVSLAHSVGTGVARGACLAISLVLTMVAVSGCDGEWDGPVAQAGIEGAAEGPTRVVQWPTAPPPKPKPVSEPEAQVSRHADRAPQEGLDEQGLDEQGLDAERRALADIGKIAFDALRTDDLDLLLGLTDLGGGVLADPCPELPETGDNKQIEARLHFCHEAIDWDAVDEAQVFAGESTGEQAAGCQAGYEDYGRIRMFFHMSDKTIWNADFFGAVGHEGKAVGVGGTIRCRKVDEAPPLSK